MKRRQPSGVDGSCRNFYHYSGVRMRRIVCRLMSGRGPPAGATARSGRIAAADLSGPAKHGTTLPHWSRPVGLPKAYSIVNIAAAPS